MDIVIMDILFVYSFSKRYASRTASICSIPVTKNTCCMVFLFFIFRLFALFDFFFFCELFNMCICRCMWVFQFFIYKKRRRAIKWIYHKTGHFSSHQIRMGSVNFKGPENCIDETHFVCGQIWFQKRSLDDANWQVEIEL